MGSQEKAFATQIDDAQNHKGTILELRWRSKQPIKLDYTVGLHCLDSEKKTVGGADYQPDILQREMAQGADGQIPSLLPIENSKERRNSGFRYIGPVKKRCCVMHQVAIGTHASSFLFRTLLRKRIKQPTK
jgi:hypothetical protein